MSFSRSVLRSSFIRGYITLMYLLEKYIGPLLVFVVRIWMARVFWDSGLSKIQSWPTTLLLFKNEYKVPLISPELAAYLATGVELSCPILLLIGLGARFAVIPMLIMTAVIQNTYLCSNEHLCWSMLLGLILCYGPGQISADFFIRKSILRSEKGWKFL